MLGRLQIGPRTRLVLLIAGLVAAFLLVVSDGPTAAGLRARIEPYGALAPLIYIVVAAGLSCLLVPGPLLAGASGALFGPVLGTAVSLASATLAAVSALLIARFTGREGAEQLGGRRFEAAAGWLERHGFAAVVTSRLTPGVPDAPVNYAAGLTRLKVWQIAAGTVVGAAPRAFGYSALGGSLDRLDSPLAIAAAGTIGAAALLGAFLAQREARRVRRNRREAGAQAG